MSRADVRFGGRIGALPGEGQTLWEIAEAIRDRVSEVQRPTQVAAQLEALVSDIREVSALTLEDELADVVAAVAKKRDSRRFLRLMGWDGTGEKTLRQCAQELGMSAEGVRQVEARFVARLNGRPVFAPALDRAERLARGAVPCSATRLEEKLTETRVTGGALCVTGLLSALSKLRGTHDLKLESVGGGLFVRCATQIPVGEIHRTCRKLVRHWGVSTVDACSEELREAKSALPDLTEIIRDVVDGDPELTWLDCERSWFWRPELRNPIVNAVRKILSVCGMIDVKLLREGVGRHHRSAGFTPPRKVLLGLCESHSEMRVWDSTVQWVSTCHWQQVLETNERILAEVLLSNEGIMPREDLEAECLRRGMNRSTFYVHLNYSPIIVRYARGVYGLQGITVPLGAVESATPVARRRRVLQDGGWMGHTRVWLGYKLSGGMLKNGTCTLPSAFRHILRGEYGIVCNGSHVGKLVIGESQGWGLSPLFRRRAFQVGDVLVLVFSLTEGTVEAVCGGDELLLEYGEANAAGPSLPRRS